MELSATPTLLLILFAGKFEILQILIDKDAVFMKKLVSIRNN